MATTKFFAAPAPGDIVWCHFPVNEMPGPGPKPRPALVVQVGTIDGQPAVLIAYGTSQRIGQLHPGEFLISHEDGDAFKLAGLSFDTKFDLARTVELPYSTRWFAVPPGAPHGQTPKLGTLHAALHRRAAAAHRAARASKR